MPRTFQRLREFWRDRVVGPKPRTYDAACEELGGAPWRTAGDTEQWFIGVRPAPPPIPPAFRGVPSFPSSRPRALPPPPPLPSYDRLPTIDTGVVLIKTPMSDRTKLALLSAGALALVLMVVAGLSGGATTQPTAPPVVAAPAVAPPVAAIAAAPSPPRRTISPSRLSLSKRRVHARHHRR